MNKNSIEKGARLRAARRAAGWHGYGMSPILAKSIGIGIPLLHSIEAGTASIEALGKAANFLRIDRVWLETGEGEMFIAPPPGPPCQPARKNSSPAAVGGRRSAAPVVGERRAAAGDEPPLSQRLAAATEELLAAKQTLAAAKTRLDALIAELAAAA